MSIMHTCHRLLSCRLAAAIILLSSSAGRSLAQSILLDAPTTTSLTDAFAIGKTLAKSNTLEIGSLDELIERVAGKIRPASFEKWGNFNAYWEATKSQRAGKVFEAINAYVENRRLARSGDAMRLLVTAAEGKPAHPADVLRALRTDEGFLVGGHDQYKFGWKAAKNAVAESKYAGMTIVTSPDQMQIIEHELQKAEAKAIRRGLPLASKWEGVKDAIQEGRLTARMPSGTMATTREYVFFHTRRVYQAMWTRLERAAEATQIARLSRFRAVSGTLKVLGKVAGGALVVLDVAAVGYQTYDDVLRYRAGEIGGGYLAAKSSMRGLQLSLAYYTFFAPDPTMVTKIVTGVAVVVLIVADDVSDRVYEARRDESRRLMESIDRDERFYAARKQLLETAGP
jgi:hypothetical protein